MYRSTQNRHAFLMMASGILGLAVAGCSEAPPEQPAKVAANKPAPHAEPAATEPVETTAMRPVQEPAPVKDEAVEPAAFQEAAGEVPPVMLTNQHAALSQVKVGDAMPDVSLPQVSGGTAKLSSLYGKAATVVVLWKGDRGMAIQELIDLEPDVVKQFGSRGVAVVGIAVDETAASARDVATKTNAASIPQLVDSDGQAFAKIGSERLPWTLVLDPSGKIVWFDIEYSLTTRRELQQALLALAR